MKTTACDSYQKRNEVIKRFEKHFRRSTPDECWEWTGAISEDGYGRFLFDGKNRNAHRIAYILFIGPLANSAELVCHHCDNRRCVNQFHLFKGSNKDNMRDCSLKGRRPDVKGEANPRSKLTVSDVIDILNSNESGLSLASKYRVGSTTIYDIRNRRNWRHI